MQKALLLALSFILTGVLLHTYAFADDDAHGGASQQPSDQPVSDTSEAVNATRTTERYTEKGATIDPVAFDIAPNGDIYVAEGSRAGGSVIDNRNGGLRRSNGVINDLKKTSVEDRLEQIKMLTEGGFYPPDTFTKTSDRVRLVKDTDSDGKADASSIFADGFNDPLDGIASGVLFHEGKVYLTNIPHLWLLEDKDGDGDADKETEDERVSLSYGWGIRWAFYGHDMHGLIKGPDGRIYFSIGDRGYNVTTKEGKQLYGPDRGAVFRMWPDGSGLELYFEGLRNPQELAFDNYGNLFTGDNNSDSGDKARFAWLPEGGDAGWRQDVQSLKDRGPWNREHMWKPRDVEKYGLDQPAWIIPPLKNVGRGPSGLAHYPGTGDVFPDNGSFLMCDYPAGVRHVHVKPDGAFFRVVEDSKFETEGSTITDVAWGYDGRLYLSDWGGGWRPNPNGYIKTMANEAAMKAQADQIAEVKQLFAEGFEKLSDEKLIELLGHADQRVRIHAQWEAAERVDGEKIIDAMLNQEASEIARLHALWAAGMLLAKGEVEHLPFISDMTESSSEVLRSNAFTALGEHPYELDQAWYIARFEEETSHVVLARAAIAIGKSKDPKVIPALLDLLSRNNNEDPAIRHAASYGLSLIGDGKAIVNQAKARDQPARLGAVLALRKLDSPHLDQFLYDTDAQVVAEAARAIYDKRVMQAMPALAARLDTIPLEMMNEPTMRRAIEANVRVADESSAMRLGKLAANTTSPETWRLLALTELDNWAKQRDREGVWGAWWPRDEQSMEYAQAAMMAYLPQVINDKNQKIATQARTLMQRHIKKSSPAELAEAIMNPEEPDMLRRSSLLMLADADKTLAIDTAAKLASKTDTPANLRIAARSTLLGLDEAAGQQSYKSALDAGTLEEQQDAIARLGAGKGDNALVAETFENLAELLNRGELVPALQLDVIEAVLKNKSLPDSAQASVKQFIDKNQRPNEAPFLREASLVGGSAERGKEVFFHHSGAVCTQCHRLDNEEAQGPNLSGIAAVHDMDYLYTSVVLPNADIVDGYANEAGQSNMKPMQEVLSPMELRDLLAYLGTLEDDPSPSYQLALAKGPGGSGPSVTKSAAKWQHAVILPSVLLAITALMVALLLGTIFMGKLAKP